MRRFGPQLVLCTIGLIGSIISSQAVLLADEGLTGKKGAKIYCFMRESGNNHNVSWNAAYSTIKRKGRGLLKTSPEHASVMITEAVVNDPVNFPDCGQYLGDLFIEKTKATKISILGSKSITTSPQKTNNYDNTAREERYSY